MSRLDAVPCPICGVFDEELWGRHYQGHMIVRCRRCGLRYLSPRRNPEENLAVYGDRYFDRRRRREADPEWGGYVTENDRRYAVTILRHARVLRPSVLDIGTGRGSFLILLSRLHEIGQVAGTDITDVNREHLHTHGIELYLGDVTELELGRWDIVTAHHVLEHVLDPNAFLSRVRSLLADRGIAHFVLPNEGSLMSWWKSSLNRARVKPRPYKHLTPEHHLWYFTPRTITRLVEANGFRVVELRSTAGAKRRALPRRLAQRGLDALHLNTWLDVVVEAE